MTFSNSNWKLLLLLAWVLWPAYAHATDPATPIVLGATVSLEGKYSEPSTMIHNAYRLWESQVNARGGILGRPVRLIIYDDGSDPARVSQLYETLITEDRVDLVLSPYGTPLTLKASEITERNRMVMLAVAASGKAIWEREHRYVFGVYATADRYFIGQLDLMARHGLDSVSIIYENSPFNRDVAEGAGDWAVRFGMRVAMKADFNNGPQELPGLLAEAARFNAHGLILSAYPPDIYHFLKLLKTREWRPAAMGMTIAPIHPDFLNKVGPIGEGIFGPSQWEPDERIPFPGTRAFIADFKAFTGSLPSYHAGSAYAACRILEDAIGKIGRIDQDKIRDIVITLNTVTIIGRFKVDHTGKQVGHNPLLIQWQQGKKEIVYPIKMQTAPAVFPATP